MLMLVKDFAAQQGVSPAMIYKHLKTHQADLEGLVIKKPKQTLLTEEAQEYLRGVMMDRTVLSVTDATQAKRIAELEAENKELLRQLAETRGALATTMGELGEQKALAATAQAVERERDTAQEQLQAAQQEVERLRSRSLWERIMNR